jgi:hypothetical protein
MKIRATTERPIFVVRLRPEPGVDDAIRALRQALKVLLRRFGLCALDVHAERPIEDSHSVRAMRRRLPASKDYRHERQT